MPFYVSTLLFFIDLTLQKNQLIQYVCFGFFVSGLIKPNILGHLKYLPI